MCVIDGGEILISAADEDSFIRKWVRVESPREDGGGITVSYGAAGRSIDRGGSVAHPLAFICIDEPDARGCWMDDLYW